MNQITNALGIPKESQKPPLDDSRNGNQAEFLNLIIDYLSEVGIVELKRFYESPFTDLDDLGIGGVFHDKQTNRFSVLLRALTMLQWPSLGLPQDRVFLERLTSRFLLHAVEDGDPLDHLLGDGGPVALIDLDELAAHMDHAGLFGGFVFSEQTVEPSIAVSMHASFVSG